MAEVMRSTKTDFDGHVVGVSTSPQRSLFVFLREVGTSEEMKVNGGGAAKKFYWRCPANQIWILQRLNFLMIDGAMSPTKFGGLAALGNGLKIEILDTDQATVLLDFLEGETIVKNADFALLAGVDDQITAAVGDDIFKVRWTLAKSGKPIRLTSQQYIQVTVQDDLTGLTSFRAMLQGFRHK